MKKIAVLFFGQPRQLEKGAEFIKPFFDFSQAGITTDYFIHTWTLSDPKHTNKCYNVGNEAQKLFPHTQLKESLRDIYNPISVCIEDPLASQDLTNASQRFVDLWEATPKTKDFQLTARGHNVFKHNSLAKYKIGQLVSSEKVINLKKHHEKSNNFIYDCVFRIRLDMAFKPVSQGNRLLFLKNSIDFDIGTPRDTHFFNVNYLKVSRGFPQCGDQSIWGPSRSLDKLFTGIIDSYYNHVKQFLARCSDGYYNEYLNVITEFLHIEIAIAQAALDHDCSVKQMSPVNGAGLFSLVRDTVSSDDNYAQISKKATLFNGGGPETSDEKRPSLPPQEFLASCDPAPPLRITYKPIIDLPDATRLSLINKEARSIPVIFKKCSAPPTRLMIHTDLVLLPISPGSGTKEDHAEEFDQFHNLLNFVKNSRNPVMIELGSNWALWSLLFRQKFKNGRNILIDSCRDSLLVGETNFELNNFTFQSHWKGVGYVPHFLRSTPNRSYRSKFPSWLDREGIKLIDLLHVDIQGDEGDLFLGLEKNEGLQMGVLNTVIATHSPDLDAKIGQILKRNNFEILFHKPHGIRSHFSQSRWDGRKLMKNERRVIPEEDGLFFATNLNF